MVTLPEQQLKNRAMLVGLVLLFTLPVLVAWYLVFFTDFNQGQGGYEHGVLVKPARQLPDKILQDPVSGISTSLYGKWTMLAVVDEACGDMCRENLYRMRQIRLAMGREMGRLQRVVYIPGNINRQELRALLADYNGQLILPAEEASGDLLAALEMPGLDNAGAIHLIDPAGFYMMIYPFNTDPGGIIKDLKRLLRISKQE